MQNAQYFDTVLGHSFSLQKSCASQCIIIFLKKSEQQLLTSTVVSGPRYMGGETFMTQIHTK